MDLGTLHPQVVHFAIALLLVGVLFRVVGLLGKPAWLNPAAVALLVLGTASAVVSVRSGDDAHGPVERTPGARSAVVEHEEWGERTRNIFLAVVALELLAFGFKDGQRTAVRVGLAALALAGAYAVYETGEHGGELVYAYAGGVGIRSGDPQDVGRLLLAGLYHQAQLDRREGRSSDASGLFTEMARRWPNDTSVRLLAAESLLRDRRDAQGALAARDAITLPATSTRLIAQAGGLRADALIAAGRRDSARAVLQELTRTTPNTRLQAKLDSLR